MKKTVLILMFVLSVGLPACAQTSPVKKTQTVKPDAPKNAANQTKDAAPVIEREKFDPKANADEDLSAAVAKAQKENKRIILDIGGEWCVWCRTMDNFLIKNSELARLRDENFVWVKVNFSEENENKEFLAKYPEIKGYPHLYVLEKDGKFLYSKDTAELEAGKSYNLQKFTDFLKQYSMEKNVVQ